MKRIALTLIAALALVAPLTLHTDAQAQVYPRPTVLLQDVASGNLVTLGRKGLLVLDVPGHAPTAGTKWALDLNRGSNLGTLTEQSGAIRGGPAAFGSVNLIVSLSSAAVPTTSMLTGATSPGDIALQGTNLWMRVQVQSGVDPDTGAPVYVDPGAGKVWAVRLNGGTALQAIADDVTITKIIGSFRSVNN